MLAASRAFAKSWVAAVLIGLLIVSFAVFGIQDVVKRTAPDAVIKVGGRSITGVDFKREFDNYKARLEQQAGQPIPLELAVQNGLERQVVEGLAARESFAELLHKAGVRPSDSLVVAQISKIPAFFDQVSGRFDKATYASRLGENGLTPAKFDQVMRDDIAQAHWATATVNGLRVPRAYSALRAVFAMEDRDVGYFRIDPRSVPQPTLPTDAQLTAFMRENAAQLTRPEFRILTVVRFSPAQVGAGLPVDEAELKKRYDFRKDTLSTPETRTIVQIPARDAAAAQQIGARLSAGEAPAAVAKALGVDAISYANKPQTAIADRKVGVAAFAMKPGQIAPVQGDLGVAIVQVVAVAPGRAVTLEEARPQLEAELRKDAAAEKVYALTQAYDDAHQGGASLAEAAQKAGVPAVTIGPVTKSGQDQQAQPVQGLNQKLMETAFGLPAGGESELQDAGGGEFFAVRVERVLPPALPPLAEVKPQLVRVWMMREVSKQMEARATALAARVRKGESLEA
ncbi:MAG: rotamase family protein, partial [Caulobacteraceae bacterium]|nr:rotamase family protein [Caulobacteraceae bacterium]